MKKLKLALLSLLAFVVGAFCLVACGESNYEGTYKFASVTMSENGTTTTIKVGETYEGRTLTEDFMVIELKNGGKAVASQMGETVNGTWEKAETKGQIVITVDGDPQTFTCDGTTMTMEYDGVKITLKKNTGASIDSSDSESVATSSDSESGDSSVGAAKIEGTYKFESMTMSEDGTTITMKAGEEFEGVMITADYMVIELKDGGIAVVSGTVYGGTRSFTGTWEKGETEGQIVITIEGDPQTFTCDGESLTATDGDFVAVLKKSA